MHSKVYDNLSCSLASEDILVIAPDPRGFGRWYHQETEKSIDYLGTIEDRQTPRQSEKRAFPCVYDCRWRKSWRTCGALDSKRMTTIKCRSCGHFDILHFVLQAKRVEEIIDSMCEWLNTV